MSLVGEIVRRINDCLEGKISEQDLNNWANQILIDEPEDTDHEIGSFVTNEVIFLLNMLHDKDERFRATREELEEARDWLLGRKSYEAQRIILYNYTHKAERAIIALQRTIDQLKSKHDNIDFQEFLRESSSVNSNTVYGMLIFHAVQLIQAIRREVKTGIVEPYVGINLVGIGKANHLPTRKLLDRLSNIHECLSGKREIFLTVNILADENRTTKAVISL